MKTGNSDLLKEFTAEQVAKLDEIIARFKGKPGGLIPVLEEATTSELKMAFEKKGGRHILE